VRETADFAGHIFNPSKRLACAADPNGDHGSLHLTPARPIVTPTRPLVSGLVACR
jgi:hypothetical protein